MKSKTKNTIKNEILPTAKFSAALVALSLTLCVAARAANNEPLVPAPVEAAQEEALGVPGGSSAGQTPSSQTDFCGLVVVVCPEELTGFAGYDITSYATDPNHERAVQQHYERILEGGESISTYIKRVEPKSPITGEMVQQAAEKYDVNPALMVAIMQQDSSLGTAGLGARTFNPGNVATYGKRVQKYESWDAGVEAVGRWLSKHKE